jgi:hypothetical protein
MRAQSCRVAGATNVGETTYFNGRKRKSQTIVQGRFKKSLSFNDVGTGQEFHHPLNVSNSKLAKLVLAIIRRLSPAVKEEYHEEGKVAMVSPVAATCQVLAVHRPGSEPCILEELVEDTVLLGATFAAGDVSAKKRRSHLSHSKNLKNFEYSPELVYTFDFYQHLMIPSDFTFDLSVTTFDMSKYLNGQPLSVMAKSYSLGAYLWNFELWHEKLLAAWEETISA